MRPDENLGEEIFKVNFDDYPVLLVNSRLTRWKEISTEPMFTSLVYPSALRTVLTRILLIERYFDTEDLEDWRSRWLIFAEGRPKVGKMPSGGDQIPLEDWIEDVVAAFCRQNRIYDLSSRRLNEEGGSETS